MAAERVGVVPTLYLKAVTTVAQALEQGGLEAFDWNDVWDQSYNDIALFPTYRILDDGDEHFLRLAKDNTIQHQKGVQVQVYLAVVDCDLHDENGARRGWSSRQEAVEAIEALGNKNLPPPHAIYTTPRGYRLVWILEEPWKPSVATPYLKAFTKFCATQNLPVDLTGSQWWRLFKLPKISMDGVQYEMQDWLIIKHNLDAPRLDLKRFHEYLDLQVRDTDEALAPYHVDTDHGAAPDDMQVYEWTTIRDESEFYKSAKESLFRRPFYSILFRSKLDKMPQEGKRNNTLMTWVASIVGGVWHCNGASPANIYLLMQPLLDHLHATDPGGGWPGTAWRMICKTWNKHQAKISLFGSSIKQKEADQANILATIIAKWREMYPNHPALHVDDQTARIYIMERALLSFKSEVYALQPDGNYYRRPLQRNEVAAHLMRSGMSNLIQVHIPTKSGARIATWDDLAVDYATTLSNIRYRSGLKGDLLEETAHGTELILGCHALADLEPQFSPIIDEWLKAMLGVMYESVTDWACLAVDLGYPICALNLMGPPGVGKSMFTAGLADLFIGSEIVDGYIVARRFNAEMTKSPLLAFEEGADRLDNENVSFDGWLRNIITRGSIPIEEKGREIKVLEAYPRIVITSNNTRILSVVYGRTDMTLDDQHAVAERFLMAQCFEQGRVVLNKYNNFATTGSWVGKHSDRLLARHILALREQRKLHEKELGKTRFLVTGHLDQTEALRALVQTNDDLEIAKALLKVCMILVEKPDEVLGNAMLTADRGCVAINRHVLREHVDRFYVGRERIPHSRYSKILIIFSEKEARIDNKRYHIVRISTIKEWALQEGLDLEGILNNEVSPNLG